MPTSDAPSPPEVHRFTAIGTGWQIDTERPLPDRLKTGIAELCEDFDQTWSRFRPDSLVAEIAHAPVGGRFEVPVRDLSLLDLYDRLHTATARAVDPLVGRDLELLGYDAGYSLTPDRAGLAARIPDSWTRDVRRDGTALITNRPQVVDVGAAGKGHLVDLIAQELQAARVEQFVVDGSGDLRHAGPEPVTVGLEHPTRPDRVIGTVPLQDAALCASATTRRAWGDDLHHVLDARTGKPVSDVVATWTIAADAATADGLATALFVAEPGQLEGFAFSWVRMLADGRVQWSDDFPGELFL
ncbi:FAD:protein FMN transferase [Streptomyces sp. NPDC058045]|uniref:FAD:protein FMN transferase n=1 Tax=Streptomyces sp. NPDC058045 TaxID=3346311 RepID=UPI0036E87CEC